MQTVYLDFNSTTPLAPSVEAQMRPFFTERFALPNSDHWEGAATREAIEDARASVSQLLGGPPHEVVFTSGGTEANNLAVLGAARGIARRHAPARILMSPLEHVAVRRAAKALLAEGWELDILPCDGAGRLDPSSVRARLRAQTRLCLIAAANAGLGTVQAVDQIVPICQEVGAIVHCDATVAAGRAPLPQHADLLAIAGHQMYGPKGIGALRVRGGVPLVPLMYGSCREMGLRPGAENVTGIVGLGSAARLAIRGPLEAGPAMAAVRDQFWTALQAEVRPKPQLVGSLVDCLPNTLVCEFTGRDARELLRATPHLAATPAWPESRDDELAHALRAIGMPESRAASCIRFSLGWTTNQEQIERAVGWLAAACAKAT
jgi:cysteine desulfurase